MKKSFIYFCILGFLSLSLSSCQTMYFAEVQPRGAEQLKRIPKAIQGNYLSPFEMHNDMDSYYHISESSFIVYEEAKEKLPLDSVNYISETGTYVKDSLIYLKNVGVEANGFPFKVIDDTIHVNYFKWEEQQLGKDFVLTQDKDVIYFNMRDEDHEDLSWNCSQLDVLKNGDLILWGTDIKKEKQLIQEILNAHPTDNTSNPNWEANPSKRQFRKYIKAGGFQEMLILLAKIDEEDLPQLLAHILANEN